MGRLGDHKPWIALTWHKKIRTCEVIAPFFTYIVMSSRPHTVQTWFAYFFISVQPLVPTTLDGRDKMLGCCGKSNLGEQAPKIESWPPINLVQFSVFKTFQALLLVGKNYLKITRVSNVCMNWPHFTFQIWCACRGSQLLRLLFPHRRSCKSVPSSVKHRHQRLGSKCKPDGWANLISANKTQGADLKGVIDTFTKKM